MVRDRTYINSDGTYINPDGFSGGDRAASQRRGVYLANQVQLLTTTHKLGPASRRGGERKSLATKSRGWLLAGRERRGATGRYHQ